MHQNWRPDLSSEEVVLELPARVAPYYQILKYCRHIGVQIKDNHTGYWVARVRRKDGGYAQRRMCLAFKDGYFEQSYVDACLKAEVWFNSESISRLSSDSYQVGSNREINICPIGDTHTVGHAMRDYLEWKLLAATKSHFETLVSLVNYHLVPRVSNIPVEQFDGENFQQLAVSVLETPPKKGRQQQRRAVGIRSLSQDELRKRKKSFNALVSILRGSFELAWERGKIETDRPLRCLRRLPNVDRPRVVFLDRPECRRLLAASHTDFLPLVLAALYTGCRANELITMLVSDFSRSTNSLFVGNPKGRRTRHVLLPDEGTAFFSKLVGDRCGTERLFLKANRRTWGSEYKSYFQRARTEANLPNTLTFHGLRHTYASHLLQNGASILTVADQLGHANTQTVSSTYGHLTAKTRASDVNRCFTPLMDAEPDRLACSNMLFIDQSTEATLPTFHHREPSSWPRSNHSRFSGSLLAELRPSELDP